MLTPQQYADWEENGFILIRGFVAPELGRTMSAEAIAGIRTETPSAHVGEASWATREGLFIQPEAQALTGDVSGQMPEDVIAKAFNTHLFGTTNKFAVGARCGSIVENLLGAPSSVFQSMLILKNPGAWGQPWHQDAYYFNFDTSPQIGLWLAISEATLENGCLSVLPGSHKDPVHTHGPDKRPGANYGYREVDFGADDRAVPVLMQPGDLLVFHSHLLHRSVDNQGVGRREAMVLHYASTGSINLADAKTQAIHKLIYHWLPVETQGELVQCASRFLGNEVAH
jgi:phytanoyl-CoA hydroxylase